MYNEENQEMLVSTQMMLLSGITLRLLDCGVACRPFLNRWGQEQVSLDVLQKLQSHFLGWGVLTGAYPFQTIAAQLVWLTDVA